MTNRSESGSTSFEEVKNSPAYQLWLASNAWLRLVRRALEPLQLTHVQYIILASTDRLAAGGQPVTQAEVCRFAALDENMTSQVVKTLAAKGLLERVRHPADRRAHALRLTEAGRRLNDKAGQAVRPATERFFAPLGDQIPTLAQLLQNLNDQAGPHSG